jgi:cytochrome oxidase Cu insertion factor (SCO1/SenC/PrrC family)
VPGGECSGYFVGVDLARDTPAQVRSYLSRIDPSFTGLTGSAALLLEAVNAVRGGIDIGEPDARGEYLVGHPAWGTVYLDDDMAHRRSPFGVRQQDWFEDLPRMAKGEYR